MALMLLSAATCSCSMQAAHRCRCTDAANNWLTFRESSAAASSPGLLSPAELLPAHTVLPPATAALGSVWSPLLAVWANAFGPAVDAGVQRSLSRAEAHGLMAAAAAARSAGERQLVRAGWLHRLCSRSSCSWHDWQACKHGNIVLCYMNGCQMQQVIEEAQCL